MTSTIRWSLIGAVGVLAAIGLFWYDRHARRYPATDDAYVIADVVRIAAQVEGRVVQVPVKDQQSVSKGQLLFAIEPDQYRDRKRSADAALEMARRAVAADAAAVDAAQAAVADAQAQANYARLHYRRTKGLVERQMASPADLDEATAQLKSAQAALSLARAREVEAQRTLGTPGERNERIVAARAAVNLAALDLAHTRVVAPCDGVLASEKLQVGDYVAAGTPQFALVCTHRYWVQANYKETDLERIRPGQRATIRVDVYPGHLFHGIVESISPAGGAAFSLLPPENATGNWVKVTQRVSVRVLVVDATRAFPLRVQTSCEVTIDTGAGVPLGGPPGLPLTDAEAERIGVAK